MQLANLLLRRIHQLVHAVQRNIHRQRRHGQERRRHVAVAAHSIVVEQNDLKRLRESGCSVAAPRDRQLLRVRA